VPSPWSEIAIITAAADRSTATSNPLDACTKALVESSETIKLTASCISLDRSKMISDTNRLALPTDSSDGSKLRLISCGQTEVLQKARSLKNSMNNRSDVYQRHVLDAI